MKAAFITGATGFLGINLVQELLSDGWQVTALHRKTSNLKYLKRFNIKLVEGAITDKDSLIKAMPDGADAVFHVAANTSMWSKFNEQQYQDNVIGTRNMTEVALQKKVKRFIHTSSISAFGHHREVVDESTESNALSSKMNYTVTKYQAELEVEKAIQKGLDAVFLNPCDIMGPYDTHNWAQVIQAVYNNDVPGIPPGNAVFCHVKDVARAHITAVDKGRTGERYLLGGADVSLRKAFNTIERFIGRKESTFVLPRWLLRAVVPFYMLQSKFTGKEPILTYEKYLEVTIPKHVDCSKAINQLDYQITPLEDQVNDSYEWLKQENLLVR